MPTLEQPCLLLPGDSERSTVYVCVPVDPTLSNHSSVLETLMEFEGLVDLPAGVSFGELEEWSTSVVEDPSALTLEDLCAAIQVGEKLGAHNTPQLVEAFAARLKRTCWDRADEKAAMLQAWLRLSKHAQQLVLRKLPKVSAKEVISWPMTMQQALADSWVSRSSRGQYNGFSIAYGHAPQAVLNYLALLARTDPALPSLSSLSVECAVPTAEAASRLSAVLLHHPALDDLDLRRLSWAPCGHSPPAAIVLRTLPQLTAVTSLTLSTPAPTGDKGPPTPAPTAAEAEAAAQVMQAMAAAISALPRLAEFSLHSMPSTQHRISDAHSAPSSPKRRRTAAVMDHLAADGPPPPTLNPVIAALSTAPALKSLTLPTPANPSAPHLSCCSLHGPFLALSSLTFTVVGTKSTCVEVSRGVERTEGTLGPLFGSAPLTQLTWIQFNSPDPLRQLDDTMIHRVFAGLDAACTHALEEIEFHLGPTRPQTSVSGLSVGLTPTDEDADASVSFCITAEIPSDAPRALIAAAVKRARYKHCFIHVNCGADQRIMKAAWSAVGPVIQSLTDLTAVELFHMEVRDDIPPEHVPIITAMSSQLLSVPLGPFTQLTSLTFFMPPACGVPLSHVAVQLAALPQLRKVCLRDFVYDGVQEFEACFAPLTALTSLFVAVRPVTAALVRAFAKLAAAMPSLVHGGVGSCDGPAVRPEAPVEGYAAADWCEGLLELPCRGRYVFECCNDDTPAGVEEAVRRQLVARGAEVEEKLQCVDFDWHARSATERKWAWLPDVITKDLIRPY